MLIPRYWSRAESTATTPAGKFVRFHVWRGSRSSPAEAQTLAQEAVGRIADRIRSGAGFPERYAYGDRPLAFSPYSFRLLASQTIANRSPSSRRSSGVRSARSTATKFSPAAASCPAT